MSKILFICKSNVGRSQMAEAFFMSIAPAHSAFSAGTHVELERENNPISTTTKKVIECMQGVGLDVSDKKMNLLTSEMVKEADMVIAITPKETLPDYLQHSPKLEVWNIPDAGGTDTAFHVKVRDMIKVQVDKLTQTLGL